MTVDLSERPIRPETYTRTGHWVEGGEHVCHEPASALCRQVWECDCEWLSGVEQNPETLRWEHYAFDENDEEVWHHSHHQDPLRHCNLVEYIRMEGTTDMWRSEHLGFGHNAFDIPLPDGEVYCEWVDEWVEWDYIGMPRSLGRYIGRSVVARWADERLGIDL